LWGGRADQAIAGDGETDDPRFAKSFAKHGAFPCASLHDVAQKAETGDSEKTLVNTGETVYLQGANRNKRP
jgi:hypothetical protein